MTPDDILSRLRAMGGAQDREGMARFGINVERALGVSVARILASMVDEPERVTRSQMDAWARDFDSWDLCDQCCANLFWRTPFAHAKALAWSGRRAEFVKRAGFALMAAAAVKDRRTPDARFLSYLPVIEREAGDDRNFVRKAVNWSLRQIGKRNPRLRRAAVTTARRIARQEAGSARWIAADALRELESSAVRDRLSGR